MKLGPVFLSLSYAMRIKEKNIKKWYLKPPVRIELTTPGLQDQCSNHWAMEAADDKKMIKTFLMIKKSILKSHRTVHFKTKWT